jgi:putative oxidoreductase
MKNGCEKFKPYASLFLRIALGAVFIYHGYGKVFGESAAMGTAWNPYGMPSVLQLLVAWGEFAGGIALLIGFLTPIAAIGIITIMAGAIVTVTGKNGFNMMNQGYEYNFVLIMMCLALIANGAGACSIDCRCTCKKSPEGSA